MRFNASTLPSYFFDSLPALLALSLLSFTTYSAVAGSATWNQNPTSGEWFDATNWTPQTVPDETSDVATFGISNVTDVTVDSSDLAYVGSIVFTPGASSYTLTGLFGFAGQGVVNNSGAIQNFAPVPFVAFNGNSTAGSDVIYTLYGAQYDAGATASFADNASAGGGTFFVHGQRPGDALSAGISFLNHSTAANSTIIDYGPEGGKYGADTLFDYNSSAGNSRITANSGAIIDFSDSTTAANSTLTIDGGELDFEGKADGAQAQIILTNGGLLRILGRTGDRLHRGHARRSWHPGSDRAQGVFNIGSLAGDGTVQLSNQQTSIGSNGESTTFSGVIEQTGVSAAVSKIGSGTLTLNGANTYTGSTTITGGVLVTNNKHGATGTGSVNVEAGTLGGRGIVLGAVTIGTGSGSGASLAPSVAAKQPLTLSCKSSVTFKSDGTYTCQLNSKKPQADQVSAKGITIESGAQFDLETVGNKRLPPGTVFTVISNTSANPITGTFANLADGAVISVGRNNLVATYEGGDGNDFTLTVQ